MDINKLRTSVFEKTGIKIDTNDPIFALVALNEAVLAECVERHIAILDQAAEKLKAQTDELTGAGERYRKLMQRVADLGETEKGPQIASALVKHADAADNSSHPAVSMNLTLLQSIVGAAVIACLGAVLTLGGELALQKDNPAPPVSKKITAPGGPTLTPDQILMIENGEKYAKMWPKLDATTQAEILRIIQQP
jgi:hypothetical protein